MNTNAFLIRQLAFSLQKRTIPLDVEHLHHLATKILELVPPGSEVKEMELSEIQLSEEGTFSSAWPFITPVAKSIIALDYAEAEKRLLQSFQFLEPGSFHSPEE